MQQPDYVERARAYQRAYYLAHREAKIAYQRRRWDANREALNASRRKPPGDLKNKARGIPSGPDYNRRYHHEVRAESLLLERIRVLQKVSGLTEPECARCRETDVLVLQVNHVNGGGRQDFAGKPFDFRRAILSGERTTDDLNVLCANCNIRYEYTRGQRHLPRGWEDLVAEMTNGRSVSSERVSRVPE